MKIGIVGNGFVGKATKLLKSDSIDIIVYDIRPEACEPLNTTLADLELCDLVFYCLPTPIGHNGSCHTQILEDAICKLSNPFKVIRSTVPIGFSKSVECFFMPEFLTEANWKEDFITSSHWVFGLLDNNELNEEFKKRITKLFETSKNENAIMSSTIHFVSTSEAEFLKLAKNCFLAAKVGIFNELYSLAMVKGVEYSNVKALLKLDNRIGTTHMNVPGINNMFGYGGTCFPKDTHSLYNQFQSADVPSYYFQTSLIRNETVDRPQREWATDYWRTTIPTNKKISLIIGNDNNYMLSNHLLEQDHIVIYCNENKNEDYPKSESFLIKHASFVNKQFFPKLDFVWDLDTLHGNNTNYNIMKNNVTKTVNVLELAETHKCQVIFFSDNNNEYCVDMVSEFRNMNKEIQNNIHVCEHDNNEFIGKTLINFYINI